MKVSFSDRTKVHRRTGGLEMPDNLTVGGFLVHRRTGGLEMTRRTS